MYNLKKGEDPLVKKVIMVPIPFQQPFCHNAVMVPVFTYRDETKGLFRQFRCETCGHASSRLVAVPKEKVEKK